MSKSFLVTTDFTKNLKSIVKKFRRDAVLVGIPEAEASREGEDDQPINNAALLAIHNFGSPAANIPSRPVMDIGLENAQPEIIKLFRSATIRALTGDVQALDTAYIRVGIVASNSIKKAINSQEGIKPIADSTLAAREARGFQGEKALIVTAQMRNAITYVVRGG